MNHMKNFIVVALAVASLALSGCTAMKTAVKKRDLEVSTQLSETVWLDPVGPDKRTVFVQFRDTSDKQGMVQAQPIISAIQAKGYKIINDPEAAQYWVMLNVRKIGKSDANEASAFLSQGYGGAIAGGVVGSAFGGGNGQVAAGIAGATIGFLADSMVEDVLYTMVTDVKISEKARDGVIVNKASTHNIQNGMSGGSLQTSNEQRNRKEYYTRVVSTANKMNLEFAEARPELVKGLINVMSGML